MSRVDLGFLEKCEPWQVESYLFPSKVGGKPAWLSLENLPKPEDLSCKKCQKPMIFLCQIYAPYEESDDNFHRTLFIFICKNPDCCERNSSANIQVFRSTLKRQNKYYSFDPPEDKRDPNFSLSKWLTLCNLCGCVSDKHCSKCKKVAYCSRDHQILDWKEGHKNECEKETNSGRKSIKLFPEWEVVIEEEVVLEKTVDEDEELQKLIKLQSEGKAGTLMNVSNAELEMHASVDEDKAFSRFRKRIGEYQDQILRYERGGQPLWIAEEPKPENIPACEYCGSIRQFELQIMPQLLSSLEEYQLDWGVIVVYTCSKSCSTDDGYKNEFVFKQDVSIKNV